MTLLALGTIPNLEILNLGNPLVYVNVGGNYKLNYLKQMFHKMS
jgi:hypothetical protein